MTQRLLEKGWPLDQQLEKRDDLLVKLKKIEFPGNLLDTLIYLLGGPKKVAEVWIDNVYRC
jgi:hypothetical protein